MSEWIQFSGIILTVLGTFVFLWKEMKTIEDKVQDQIQKQSNRTDRLYEMFCDMQKQMKDEILDMKKEQYEFMKQQRK